MLVSLCVEGRGVGGKHRVDPVDPGEEEMMNITVAFGFVFRAQEGADTFPSLDVSRQQVWSDLRVVNEMDQQLTRCRFSLKFIKGRLILKV